MATKDIKISDLTSSIRTLGASVKNHAAIIFILLALAALIYTISAVNSILSTPSDDSYRLTRAKAMTSAQFDQATIRKIELLGDRQTPPEPTTPGGRTNPFVE